MSYYQSAKDMLAMYPQRYAEGGTVEETPTTAQAPVPAPAPADMRASQSWTPPSVQARQTGLTPIFAPNEVPAGYQGRYIDPTVLSSSQQYARTREEQQRALEQVLSQANAPISKQERLGYAQQLRSGALSIPDLQEKVLNPLLEQRVKNAYAAIGRKAGITDDPNASYESVRQAEYDAWLNKLKSGEVSGKEFENKFLTAVANTQGQDLTNQFDYVNNARKMLGLPLIPKEELKKSKLGSLGGIPRTTSAISPILAAKPLVAKKPVVSSDPIPVKLDAAPTQLFSEGGAVKK